MQLKRSNRPTWECSVVTLLVAASMWMSIGLYAKRDQVAKEKLLMLELETMRNFIVAYTLEHREIPKSLWSLVPRPSSNHDPFGNPYHYNPKTGWVSTTTKPYILHW